MFTTKATDWPTWRLMAVSTLSILGLTGCMENDPSRLATHQASGTVTFEGRPIAGAFLALHPKHPTSASHPTATALVQADGSYSISTYDGGDGAPAGDYVVTVEWQQPVAFQGELVPGPNLLPAKYSNPATSDVTVRVSEGQNQLPSINLRR